jgi:hypothetical protein
MNRLRSAFIIAGLLLCFSGSLAFAFGPLWAGNGGGVTPPPGCSPPARLAALPRHFMVGLQSTTGAAGYMASMGVPWDISTEYVLGPASTVAPGSCNGGWQSQETSPNGCGSFVSHFLTSFQPLGFAPWFTYYVAQVSDGFTPVIVPWLNASTSGVQNIVWYFNDYVRMLQYIQTYGSGGPVFVHPEPDVSGFLQNFNYTASSAVNNIASYVGPDGFTGLSTLPNTLAGFWQAYVVLRNHSAPNAILSWQVSQFAGSGGGYAPTLHPSNAATISAANVVAAWYASMFAGSPYAFDIINSEFSDMDSAFYKLYCAANSSAEREWYDLAAFTNFALWNSTIHTATGLPIVAWQIPSGNTIYDTENNSLPSKFGGHFQDDRAQYLLQQGNPYLPTYIAAGVIGATFSQDQQWPGAQCNSGASGTAVYDYAADGITNPAPIGIPSQALGIVPGFTTNNKVSVDADDDGGWIRHNAAFAQALATCPGGQAIGAASLSNTTFPAGSPSGTTVGTITVPMTPASPAFSGTLTVAPPGNTSFQIH